MKPKNLLVENIEQKYTIAFFENKLKKVTKESLEKDMIIEQLKKII